MFFHLWIVRDWKRFCFKADFETSYVIEENKDNSVTFNINILYGDASIDTNKKIVSKIRDKINSLLWHYYGI